MNEELEQLQKIGAQKIHEQTHIPLLTVQALIHSSYDGFSRVQFLGFISILEREYKLELKVMRENGLTHFDVDEESEDEGVFVVTQKRQKKTYLLVIALIIFIAGILYQIFVVNKEEDVKIVDNAKIEEMKNSISPLMESEKNSSVLLESSSKKVVTPIEKKEKIVEKPSSLTIESKSKVWFGYIDFATNKRYQTTFHGSKTLDPKKSWLLMFGHGYVNIIINGVVHKFTSPKTVRFLYKNGELTEIDAREFKKLNRGRKW